MSAANDYKANLSNHNADNYRTHANFVYSAKYTSAVLGLLNAQPGESIADLGCGTGELTQQIKQAVGDQGLVCGLDSSDDMIIKARVTGDPLGIQYAQADIQDYTTLDPSLKGKFDAVFSSATFHWCKANPGGVIDTIKWLLKPGGRLAFEFGGFGNTVGVRAGLHEVVRRRGIDPVPLDPWYFPTAAQYTTLLRQHGLDPGEVALYPRPTPLPTNLVGWLTTFARNSFLSTFSAEDAEQMIEQVSEVCRPDNYWSSATPGSGVKPPVGETVEEGWEIMYVRIRGVAVNK